VKVFSSEDTIALVGSRVVHADCRRPHELSAEERVLLFRYCWSHTAAQCVACRESFRQQELASDLLNNRTHLCPRCHVELVESLRAHLYTCAMLPADVRRRAREARDSANRLVKRSHELADRADVLMREAEVALAALRDAMHLALSRA
jgi:hypothetical protein